MVVAEAHGVRILVGGGGEIAGGFLTVLGSQLGLKLPRRA